ncbi:hypothetical protein SK066_17830 [Paenibacillus hunanensis]|uniref:hypothetical protein n=1 Tax=Paenibacillus hunanensis TaxID=539262 RepID=UPI002A69F17A|nr:hypothetical protein [Paenibacillus hunanensis]WPP40443.1 hypothetical protein SK066_17830 [Paenibacillus hunanensis]
MDSTKMKFAEVYWTLVQAGRRSEDSVPVELRAAYEQIKAAAPSLATQSDETMAI